MIRRRGQEVQEESSSEEEDAFSALSRTNGKGAKRKKVDSGTTESAGAPPSDLIEPLVDPPEITSLGSSSVNLKGAKTASLPMAVTSSMKRHHKPNDKRKAKMDALILELEIEKGKQKNRDPSRFVPVKKGSFVEPGEENLTSNLFVGNLAPSITEEDLSNLFSQFGELYSIKIMWPRTPEERNRGRNSGFVCFVNREDAEDAIESCNEKDPFNVGRLLTLRWGKNVKKTTRRGVGSLKGSSMQNQGNEHQVRGSQSSAMTSLPDIVEKEIKDLTGTLRPDGLPSVITLGGANLQDLSLAKPYDAEIHATGAVRVEIPKDPFRFQFISTVASYIAKDGMSMEKRLWEEEMGNPLFNFLTLENACEQQRKENIFYRWRVYSFSQGDTFSTWRTEPFVMFHPNGRYWMPPSLNEDAVYLERANLIGKSDNSRQESVARGIPRELLTGRQIERARHLRRKGRGNYCDNPSKLTSEELDEFDRLVRKELSISREKICKAMAFCFDKCLAAENVSQLLKEYLTEDSAFVTVDARVARLYLLSDVLFNSQQPGIRNAFMYRSTIEAMAPEVFQSLGKYRERNIGRMTINKLRKAVSSVLGAWTEWGVYNATFMDELEAHFEGKEVHDKPKSSFTGQKKNGNDIEAKEREEALQMHGVEEKCSRETMDAAKKPEESRGEWTNVTAEPPVNKEISPCQGDDDDVDGESVTNTIEHVDDDGIDGEDIDGDELNGEACDINSFDGPAVDAQELHAAALSQERVASYENGGFISKQKDVDVESLDGEVIDGEELHAENCVSSERVG
jgi:U2-associated protein SR140